MKRQLMLACVLFLVASTTAAAIQWQETGWSASIVSDYETGLPAVVFNIGLLYDEIPELMRLRTEWRVFSIEDGIEIVHYEYKKTGRERNAAERIYTASQSVVIVEGTQYGARVLVEDLVNGLSVSREFSYFAPRRLEVGLRFVGWDGTQETDFTGMPDEHIHELVRLKQAIESYDVVAEGVTVDQMLSQYAKTPESYPVSVILLPETGVDNNWGSEEQPIIVTFGLRVTAFQVPSPADRAVFLTQLETYDEEFTGTVYAGVVGDEFGDGAVIFLHDAMNLILEGAVAEQEDRLTIDL